MNFGGYSMSNIKIKVLDLGQMEFEKYRLVATDDHSEFIISPMVAFLVQHPTLGNVLFDTGNDDGWKDSYPEWVKKEFPITRHRSILECLCEEGLTPGDIDILILSHMHLDHVGGLNRFANTKCAKGVIIAEADLREAFYTSGLSKDSGGFYIRSTFSNIPGVEFKPINGELKLADDLVIFEQKAHTPACLGLRINLKNTGTVLVVSDTVYTQESYDYCRGPEGALQDLNFADNINALKEMQKKYDAKIIFGHDYAQATECQERGWID